jgi:hypothetical protein
VALAMPSGNVEGNANGDKSRFFEVESMEDGEFHIKFILKNKVDAFWWALLSVYGVAQDEYKEQFLSELVRACSNCGNLPSLVGEDFNIIRNRLEK